MTNKDEKTKKIIIVVLIIAMIGLLLLVVKCNRTSVNLNDYTDNIEDYIKDNLPYAEDNDELDIGDLIDNGYLPDDFGGACARTSKIIINIAEDGKMTFDYKEICDNGDEKVVINLNGSKIIVVEYGNSYIDLSAEVLFEGKPVPGLKVDSSALNLEELGRYEIIYTYEVSSTEVYTAKRIISVVDRKAPELILNGGSEVTILKDSQFVDEGYIVTDNYDKSLTDKVIIDGDVDTTKSGIYQLKYKVCDSSNNCTETTRNITVIDITEPTVSENYIIFNLKGTNLVYLDYPVSYIEAGWIVDSSDGDLSDKVEVSGHVDKNTLGIYILTYKVTNSKDNFSIKKRTVIVRDNVKPTITLNGSTNVEIGFGDQYIDPGAIANDNYDGDLTLKISTETNLNSNVVGVYYVKYTVVDSSDNKTEAVRYITVKEKKIPTITISEEKNNVVVEKGDNYNILDGVTATDGSGHTITSSITWTANPTLNLNKVGTYEITYRVKDGDNNQALPATKTIVVQDTKAPIGTIKYSTTATTNGNVTVTLATNEAIKTPDNFVKVDDTTYTRVYSNNVLEEVEIIDLANNKNKVSISINNIDKDIPTGTYILNTNAPTSNTIIVTLTTDKLINTPEGWTKVNNTKYIKSYNENTTESVVLVDTLGNVGTITIVISNIDRSAPVITLNGDNPYIIQVNPYYIDPGATAFDDIDGEIAINTSTVGLDPNIIGEYEVVYTATDKAGNTTKVTRIVKVIDTMPPTATYTLSNNDLTNQDIIVTLKSNKPINNPTDWEKVSDTEYTKVYDKNTAGDDIELVDKNGNIGSVKIIINNIDKTPPIITLNGANPYVLALNDTYKDPGATALDNVDGSVIVIPNETNLDPSTIDTYTVTYIATDKAGNVATLTRTVIVVDHTAVGNVIYSPTIPTNQSVVATLEVDLPINTPSGWKLVVDSDNKIFTKIYEVNVTDEVVNFTTIVGNNPGSATFSISNIDTKSPTGTITYSTSDLTNQSITVRLKADEPIRTPDQWSVIDSTTFEFVYDDNINTSIEIIDLAGNTSTVDIMITWIDKVLPTASFSYDPTFDITTKESVVVTLNSSKVIKNPLDWTPVGDGTYTRYYSSNGTYEVEIEDLLGNKNTEQFTITNIDKTAPVITLIGGNTITIERGNSYEELGATALDNYDGILSVTINPESVNTLITGTYSVIYTAIDSAGNITTLTRTVIVEDTKSPTGTITYSTSDPTNQSIIVTLKTSEAINKPTDWNMVSDTEYTRIYEMNIIEEVSFSDLAGNIGSIVVNISWIDKTAPTGTIAYSTSNPTNQGVTLTLTTNEAISKPTDWDMISDTEYTRIFNENIATGTVIFTDLVGNQGSVNYVIANIDKIAPVITAIGNPKHNIWTNQSVLISPVVEEDESGFSHYLWSINNEMQDEPFPGLFDIEINGELCLIAVDNAGNQSVEACTILKIDKTSPTIELVGGARVTAILDEEYTDLVNVTDNFSTNLIDSLQVTGNVDIHKEGEYTLSYTVTDLAGNTATATRRVTVTIEGSVRDLYSKELKDVEKLVLSLVATGDESNYIGTPLTESTPVTIVGLQYWDRWYLITAADLAGYPNAEYPYLTKEHAPYIVRYEYTVGAVQSIPGEMLDNVPTHTFNYLGDPEELSLYLEGLYTAITNNSEKSNTKWGETTITGTPSGNRYDDDGGLILGEQYSVLEIDQSRPVNFKYSINVTVKGVVPQTNVETFPRTIVAISDTSGSYLSWIGVRNKYLHVYSFYGSSARGSIDKEETIDGFTSIDLTTIKMKDFEGYEDKTDETLLDFNNQYLNIQVTAELNGQTKIYFNGVLYKTFGSGNGNLSYGRITIGDLRAGRGLKYIGSVYNFALYSEILNQDAITQNWNYFKSELGIE